MVIDLVSVTRAGQLLYLKISLYSPVRIKTGAISNKDMANASIEISESITNSPRRK